MKYFKPFPNDILDSSNLKEFADDNFKFYENGRKFSKQVENNISLHLNTHIPVLNILLTKISE